jgi:hypothetical protein
MKPDWCLAQGDADVAADARNDLGTCNIHRYSPTRGVSGRDHRPPLAVAASYHADHHERPEHEQERMEVR